jgi:hypothetical protein
VQSTTKKESVVGVRNREEGEQHHNGHMVGAAKRSILICIVGGRPLVAHIRTCVVGRGGGPSMVLGNGLCQHNHFVLGSCLSRLCLVPPIKYDF